MASEGPATAVGGGEGGDPAAAVAAGAGGAGSCRAVSVSLMNGEVPALWRTPDEWAYIPLWVLAE